MCAKVGDKSIGRRTSSGGFLALRCFIRCEMSRILVRSSALEHSISTASRRPTSSLSQTVVMIIALGAPLLFTPQDRERERGPAACEEENNSSSAATASVGGGTNVQLKSVFPRRAGLNIAEAISVCRARTRTLRPGQCQKKAAQRCAQPCCYSCKLSGKQAQQYLFFVLSRAHGPAEAVLSRAPSPDWRVLRDVRIARRRVEEEDGLGCCPLTVGGQCATSCRCVARVGQRQRHVLLLVVWGVLEAAAAKTRRLIAPGH